MIDGFLNINTFLLFLILLFVIYLTFKKREDSEGDSDEALVDISNSLNKLEDIERKISINAESIAKVDERIIKSEAPLQQLNRFLSGSSTAGRVGEWGLSALIKDVFPQNSNLYVVSFYIAFCSSKGRCLMCLVDCLFHGVVGS